MQVIDRDTLTNKAEILYQHTESGKIIPWSAVRVCEINNIKTVEAEPVRHGKWIKTKKHIWKKNDDGENDEWAWDYEFHNGVCCEICHKNTCIHCEPDYDEKQDCREHYICSECGRVAFTLEPYCHCGAKMDLEV